MYQVPFIADGIRRFMRKYGNVEQIEFLNFKRPEAYVTFIDCSAAYIAFVDSLLFKSNVYNIQPADSWVQPSILPMEPMDIVEIDDDPPIFNLNDDCFYHIFKYLDFSSLINVSEVCQRFANLTKPAFKKTKELNIEYIIVSDTINISFKCPNCPIPAMPLAQFRQYLKHIGEYVEEINFIAPTSVICRHRIQRYLVKIRQYAVTRLKVLRFCDAARCRELRFD